MPKRVWRNDERRPPTRLWPGTGAVPLPGRCRSGTPARAAGGGGVPSVPVARGSHRQAPRDHVVGGRALCCDARDTAFLAIAMALNGPPPDDLEGWLPARLGAETDGTVWADWCRLTTGGLRE